MENKLSIFPCNDDDAFSLPLTRGVLLNLSARDVINCTAATVKLVVGAVASIMVNVLVSGSRGSGSAP